MNVDGLQEGAVCCVRRDQSPQLMLEIRDCFWPYQRQQTPERTLGPETEFVDRVRGLFLAPACVQTSFSAADERLALDMYRRGVSMQQITRAILLGCARKYVAMLNAGTRTPELIMATYFRAHPNRMARVICSMETPRRWRA